MITKVLIVDDELPIRDALADKLRGDGYTILVARDGLEGLRVFHRERPDLVVLDVVMPNMSGLLACQRIREIAETPIIMLSARAISEDEIIEGLSVGADEYLFKPVRLNEFSARVGAVLRRARMHTSEVEAGYSDAYLTIDVHRRQVSVKGHRIHLTPTEFKLLSVLLENTGRVVSQTELLEQVWGPEYLNDVYYPRVYISQLRRKIEPDPSNPTYIQTEHRVGYRFQKRQ